MKALNIFSAKVLLAALLITTATAVRMQAQPIVLPTMPDHSAYFTGEMFNTAMIYYNVHPADAIFGIAWEAGAPIYVQDIGTGYSATCPPHGGCGGPDVIIGNNITTPNDFIMAVGYYDCRGHIMVDFYDISHTGTPSLSVTYHSSASISIPFSAGPPFDNNTVHLDVIAEHRTLPTLPVCNKFVITWDQNPTAIGGPAVCAAMGDLSAYAITTAPVTLAHGSQPDVAGIQRTVGLGTDDLGLIPYIDPPGHLAYCEYDFTTSAFTTTTLDASAPIANPRIDAMDDYTSNMNPGQAHFKIAAAATVGSGSEVRTYDDLMGAGAYFACAAGINVSSMGYPAPPYNHYNPVVALTGPRDYSVLHWTEVSAPMDALFMEPIDLNTSYTMSPNNYYWVNSSSGTPALNGSWTSISSSANFNVAMTSLNLYAWTESPSSGAVTNYKLSSMGPIAFKQGSIVTENGKVMENSWQLFPNPTSTDITVRRAKNAKETKYQIVNALGQMVCEGAMAGENTTIDISKLAAGSYIIKPCDGSLSGLKMEFIKK